MRVAMEEDRPNCARSKRGASFSHRGRWAPLSAPDTPTVKATLYAFERSCKKELLMPRTWGGGRLGSPSAQASRHPRAVRKTLRPPRGELARERLKHGICPTHAKRTRLSRLPRPETSVERNRKPLGRIPQTDDRCGLRRARQTGRRDAEQT